MGFACGFATLIGCGSSAVQPPAQEAMIATAYPLEEVDAAVLPDAHWVEVGKVLPSTSGRFVDAWWDGAAYWLVDQRTGFIWQEDDVSPTGWSRRADLSQLTGPGGNEQGLLSAARAPDGRLYAWCTDRFNGDGVLVRLRTENSWEVLQRVEQPDRNHNGGCLRFGPDGMLYLSVGDGGGANDFFGLTRDPESWCGKMVRLDVRGTTGWQVPADNPIINGRRNEFFVLGLRNPWRMWFDAAYDAWWIADVGQNTQEEISLVRAGDDAGWPFFEGTRRHQPGANIGAVTPPVLSYGTLFGRSVIGGARVDDPTGRHGGLNGAYVWTDFVSGRVGAVLPADEAGAAWQWRWLNNDATVNDVQPVHVFRSSTGGLAMLTWQGTWRELALMPVSPLPTQRPPQDSTPQDTTPQDTKGGATPGSPDTRQAPDGVAVLLPAMRVHAAGARLSQNAHQNAYQSTVALSNRYLNEQERLRIVAHSPDARVR
jgi:hypothetical protein